MTTKLDIIIFGASGHSAQYVIEQLYQLLRNETRTITWGLAGRSRTKLLEVLKNLEAKTKQNFSNILLLEADTSNYESLLTMASKTRLLINCTGPFKFHGEPVIKACIQKKCHYIDITGEISFMEKVQLFYHEEAKKNGVYIVNACGFDYIPADVGLDFVQKNFGGTLNSVDMYLELDLEGGFGKEQIGNYTTYESIIHLLSDLKELKKVRSKLFEKELPELEPKSKTKWYLHKIPFSTNYAGPYYGPEAPVIDRSQHYFYETTKSRPIQIHTYVGSTKFWHYIVLLFAFLWLLLLSQFKFTTKLLLKHPKFFSLNVFGFNPNKDAVSKFRITTTFYGRGWKGKNVNEKCKEVEDSWIVTKLKMRDPYVVTGVFASAAAFVMLDEEQRVPEEGGVYTTAAFFTGTNLVDVLKRNGLEFEVVDQGSL